MNGTFHARGEKQQPKPLRSPAARRPPCPAPRLPSDPPGPTLPPRSPEASLRPKPARAQGKQPGLPTGAGREPQAAVALPAWREGACLEPSGQRGPCHATPNPRQNPRHKATSPRVPGARPGGMKLHSPSLCQERWQWREEPSPAGGAAHPGTGHRRRRAASRARHPAQHTGTLCPLLAAPRAGQRRPLGTAVWGWVRSCVAAVQPQPVSQELAAGEPGAANSGSRGQRRRREGQARWPRTALTSAAGGSPQHGEASAQCAALAGLPCHHRPRRAPALQCPGQGLPNVRG